MSTTPKRSLKRCAAGISAGALALTGFAAGFAAIASPAFAQQGFAFTRLQGADRYGTAASTATSTFPAGAATVLLASGATGHYPDALSGNYLAGFDKSPILLTAIDTLPAATSTALSTLKAKNVVILGGTSAVSAAVQAQLIADGYNVTRIGGADRYATAKLISETPPATNVGSVQSKGRTAILASGQNFPDALVAGALGYAGSLPVEITDPNSLSADTQAALQDLNIKNVLITGGTSAVSTNVQNQVSALNGGITITRLAGVSRTETATAVAAFAVANLGFSVAHVNLARGDDFPDALTGGPHAGVEKAPIILANSPTVLGSAAANYLTGNASTLKDGHIYGGLAAISSAVQTEATTDATGQTFAVTSNNASVQPGGSATISVANAPANSTLTFSVPASCGTVNPTTATSSASGAASSTFTAASTASGSCTITVTGPNGSGGSTTVNITPFTSATTRPELRSASITGTVTPAQSNGTNVQGTTVSYTFDETVASSTAPGSFKLYQNNDNAVPGSTIVSVSGNTVTVRFNSINGTTNTNGNTGTNGTAANNVNNYTLATVVSSPAAVTDNQGQTNPDGSAPVGTASSTTSPATANTTSAPDLRSVSGFRAASVTTTAVDFTFDQNAYSVNGTGYNLVMTDGSERACTGPATPTTVGASGGTAAGGNGTTTITVVCPNTNGTSLTPPSATSVARGYVAQGTVQDAATSPLASNPLESVNVGNGGLTTNADLQSAQFIPSGTGSNATALDQVLYTFDQAATNTASGTYFVFHSDASQSTGTFVATNGAATQVLVSYPLGSLQNAVGASVGTTTPTTNINAASVGVTPVQTGATTITPGQVTAPQLAGVAIKSTTDAFGVTTYSAQYTFDKAVGTTVTNQTAFHLYDSNGNALNATTCATPTGATVSNTIVNCTIYTDTNSPATGNNVNTDIANATLGTVDAGGVTGSTAPNTGLNPEGAVFTTGGTGTPAA